MKIFALVAALVSVASAGVVHRPVVPALGTPSFAPALVASHDVSSPSFAPALVAGPAIIGAPSFTPALVDANPSQLPSASLAVIPAVTAPSNKPRVSMTINIRPDAFASNLVTVDGPTIPAVQPIPTPAAVEFPPAIVDVVEPTVPGSGVSVVEVNPVVEAPAPTETVSVVEITPEVPAAAVVVPPTETVSVVEINPVVPEAAVVVPPTESVSVVEVAPESVSVVEVNPVVPEAVSVVEGSEVVPETAVAGPASVEATSTDGSVTNNFFVNVILNFLNGGSPSDLQGVQSVTLPITPGAGPINITPRA